MIPAAKVGDVVDDRYQVVRMIGRGAMADVFEAKDLRSDRVVALKILRAAVARDWKAVKRFSQEAEIQQMIQHRNVAKLYAVGVTQWATPYLALELLRGRSLLTVLRKESAVDVIRAASYAYQALQGLCATHAVGVLHRDLKPANLMLEPSPGPVERVIVIDFGFAALGAATGLTQQGHVVGSVSYLAPERLRGEPSDARADLYGIGCILYELLAGRAPFVSANEMDVIMGHLNTTPTPPSELAPDKQIPPSLEVVVLRALAKFPNERAPDAQSMADELEASVQG